MSTRELPVLALETFRAELRRLAPYDLSDTSLDALHQHYEELRRWNRRLSLIGPGTFSQVLERHYAESLAALPLVLRDDRVLVDVGSGGGFPGLVLAAARRDLEVTLIETRERKWAFLSSAVRRSRLSCRCLNARVGAPLPSGVPSEIHLLTCRALALGPEVLAAFFERMPQGRLLLWQGASAPRLPHGLEGTREIALQGSEHRRILEIRRKPK